MHVLQTISYISLGLIISVILFGIAQVFAQEEITIPINETPKEETFIEPPVETNFNRIPLNDVQEETKSLLSVLDPIDEIDAIRTTQETYFNEKNHYIQTENINVYESPRGWGYQVEQIYQDRVEYKGYGVDSQEYTYIIPITISVSTST